MESSKTGIQEEWKSHWRWKRRSRIKNSTQHRNGTLTMTLYSTDTMELTTAPVDSTMIESAKSISPFSIEVVRNKKRFLSLRDEWDSLVESSPARLYQTFDWQ